MAKRTARIHFENGVQRQHNASLIGEGGLIQCDNWVPEANGGLRGRRPWNTTPTPDLDIKGRGIGHLALSAAVEVPALRQSASATLQAAGTTASKAWGFPTTQGNLLVAIVTASKSGAAPTFTFTGWTQAVTSTANGQRVSIYYIEGADSRSGTETVTLSASSDWTMWLGEYSGVVDSGALDKTASTTGTSSTASTGTTASTTQNEELWLGALISAAALAGGTMTNGFSNIAAPIPGSVAFDSRVLAKTVTSTGAASSAMTSFSGNWSGAIATFKAATGPSLGGRYVIANRDTSTVYKFYEIDSSSPGTSLPTLIEAVTASTGTAPSTNNPVAFASGLGGILYTTQDFASGNVRWWDGSSASAIAGAPTGRAAAFHKERFWIGGTKAKPSRLYYSAAGDETSWDLTDGTGDYFDINPDDGEPIEDVASVEDGLLVAKKSSLWFISGQGQASFAVHRLNQGGGAPGRCICPVPGGAVIAGNKDIWLWQGGTGPELISRPLERLYSARTGFVTTAFWEGVAYVCSQASGVISAFDLDTGAWWQEKVSPNEEAPAVLFARGDHLMMSGRDSWDTKLMTRYRDAQDEVSSGDRDLAQTYTAWTPEFWFGGPSERFMPQAVFLTLRQWSGSASQSPLSVTAYYRKANGSTETVTKNVAPVSTPDCVFRTRLDIGTEDAYAVQLVFEHAVEEGESVTFDIEQVELYYDAQKIA